MEGEEQFDVIVIGAGPAGTACAYVLARAGKSVLLIERGAAVGSKNVTGGRLYTYALELVEPGLYKEAALERAVVRERIMLLRESSGITIDYHSVAQDGEIPQSYTLLRASFDEWFAGKAEEQGVMVAVGIHVDDLIEKDGKIVGVRAGADEMFADWVVAADGINSFMAHKAGLKPALTPHEIGVGVKEIIALPAEVIRERFNAGDGGVATVILGGSDGVQGGGFLYTNRDSISLGLVLSPADLARKGKALPQLYQDFKTHPALQPLLSGGVTCEYSAHLVPENGWRGVPKQLYRDGFLLVGDAAGFCINTGTVLRGIDLAIVSGVAAANAVQKARSFPEVGPAYIEELEKLRLIPTMKLFAGWPKITSIPRMAKEYPDLANELMHFLFTVDGKIPQRTDKAMREILTKHVSVATLLGDAWKGFRAI